MINEPIESLTRDAVIATLIKNAEENLDALLIINGALSFLSNMTLHATKDDQIVIANLGCLIWLCDHQVDKLTDKMCLQMDQQWEIKSTPIK